MADLRCDFCADNLAEFIVGNIGTGEQQFACRFDFARLGLTVARAVLPPEELGGLAPAVPPDSLPPDEDGAAAAPPSKSRRRKRVDVVNATTASATVETPSAAPEDG